MSIKCVKFCSDIFINQHLFQDEKGSSTKLLLNNILLLTSISEILTIIVENSFLSILIFNFAYGKIIFWFDRNISHLIWIAHAASAYCATVNLHEPAHGDNKYLLIIADANSTNLYDNLEKIPFNQIATYNNE